MTLYLLNAVTVSVLSTLAVAVIVLAAAFCMRWAVVTVVYHSTCLCSTSCRIPHAVNSNSCCLLLFIALFPSLVCSCICIRCCLKHKKAGSETPALVTMREVEKSAEEYIAAADDHETVYEHLDLEYCEMRPPCSAASGT